MLTREQIHRLIDDLPDDDLAGLGQVLELRRGKKLSQGVAAVGPFTEYVLAAMRRATFKPLDGEGIWGEIPGLPGPWANAPTEVECRAELQSVLEDWILVGVALHHSIPPIDGLEIRVGQIA